MFIKLYYIPHVGLFTEDEFFSLFSEEKRRISLQLPVTDITFLFEYTKFFLNRSLNLLNFSAKKILNFFYKRIKKTVPVEETNHVLKITFVLFCIWFIIFLKNEFTTLKTESNPKEN